MAGTTYTLAGNNLQSANIVIEQSDDDSFPDINAPQYEIAHDNQSVIPFTSYPSKTITMTGYVYSLVSIADCDAQIQTFKSYFIGTDLALVIGKNSGTVTYTATTSKVVISRPGGLMYAPFTITFKCDIPFSQASSQSTAWNTTGNTSSPYTPTAYAFTGTAPYQLPIITITYSSTLSGGTNTNVYVANQNTGQAINVIRSWSTGDVLVIDCTQKTVTVNGSPVAFTGAFPLFVPGSGTINYSDGFTARTFAFNVVYTPMSM